MYNFVRGRHGDMTHCSDSRSCSKTCLVGLLNRLFIRGKNRTNASARVEFSSEKSNELTDQQDMFCFNHASALYTSNNIEKNVNQLQIRGKNVTGNPPANWRCHAFAARALNMSCSFGQSARSIESRRVINQLWTNCFVRWIPVANRSPQNLSIRHPRLCPLC